MGLLAFAGLRVGDLVALERADIVISQRKGHVVVREGKGGHRREVPLSRWPREGWFKGPGRWRWSAVSWRCSGRARGPFHHPPGTRSSGSPGPSVGPHPDTKVQFSVVEKMVPYSNPADLRDRLASICQ